MAQNPQAAQNAPVPQQIQREKTATGQSPRPAQAAKTRSKRKPSAAKQDPPPPEQTAPPAPLTLDQQPAVPPQVSYQTGELTIIAQNSTLGDILRAVRNRTGATFDIPPQATERVVGRFGPGPAREVLATLLNGSHFNYVMLGSAKDPNAMSELILTPKSGADSVANAGNTGQPVPQQQVQQFPDQSSTDGGMEGENAPDAGDENVDQGQVIDQQNQDQDGAQGFATQPNGQPVVKTPQQLLQELQQQQLQQQQLQQQQQQQGQNPQGQQPTVVYPNPQPAPPPQRPQ